MLYKCFVGDSYRYIPSPHGFESMTLQSGIWSDKSITELLSSKARIAEKLHESKNELDGLHSDLKDLRKAKIVSRVAVDSKNGPLKTMKEAYPEYFDDESENNTTEGIDQLGRYLSSEISAQKKNRVELKKKYDEIKEALEAKKAVEENTNLIIPFTTFSPIIFSIFLSIFSFCIYFKLIDTYLINFDMPEIIIPTIITSTVLFI